MNVTMKKILIIVVCAVSLAVIFAPSSHAALSKKKVAKAAERNWIETKWEEPEWSETSIEALLLRFRNLADTKGRYLEKRSFIISGKGKPTRGEQTISSEYRVIEAGENDSAKLRVKWHRLSTRGTGSNLMRFFKNSSPVVAHYSVLPDGNVTSFEGFMPTASLPVFPEEEVKTGSIWKGESSFAYSPVFPFLLAAGEMNYLLEGVAWVDGNQWAEISFKGDIDLPKSGIVIRKIIGVKKSRKPLGSLKGALVDEVAPELPGKKAGIESGDLVLRYNDKRISSWSDFKYAISTAEGDGPFEIVVRRSGRRETLSITPEIAVRGIISGTGRVNGRVVFDVTRGVLVRLEISPLSMRTEIRAKGLKIEQKVVFKGVTELLGVELPEDAAKAASSSPPKAPEGAKPPPAL